MARDKRSSEFGGTPGLIQQGEAGLRHELTAYEQARLERAAEAGPDVNGGVDSAEAALIREWEREGR